MGKSFGGSAKRLAGFAAGLGSVAAASAALKDSVAVTQELASSTSILARVTGLSTKEASRWAAVADARKIEGRALNQGFISLSKNISSANDGVSTATKLFRELGVSQKTLQSGKTGDVLLQVADAFERMPAGADKATTAQKLFGRQAQNLLPLLDSGSEGIRKQLELADKYGLTMDQAGVKKAQQAAAAQRELGMALDGVKIAFATRVLPAITAAGRGLANFIHQLRTGQGAAGGFAGGIGTAFNATKNAVGTAINAITGFIRRNREDISAFGRAWANVGRLIAGVFSATVLPVVKRVFPAIRQIVQGQLRVIQGVVRVFSGIMTGDFSLAWKGIRGIFSGSLKAIGGLIRGVTVPFRELAHRLGQAIVGGLSVVSGAGNRIAGYMRSALTRFAGFANNFRQKALGVGRAVVNGIVAGIKALPGKIVEAGKWLGRKVLDAVKDFLGISSPSKAFIDVGKNIVGGLAKGLDIGDVGGVVKKHFGGMAKLAGELVSAGTIKLANLPVSAMNKLFGEGSQFGALGFKGAGGFSATGKIAQSMGLQVTSGYRPGDPGWHGKNRARDYGGSPDAMKRFALTMAGSFGSKLLELIHTPMGFGIKNGQRVAPYAQADHYDHVHVAMQRGGKLRRPTVIAGEEGRQHPEYYISTNPRDRRRMVPLAAEALQNVVGMARGGALSVRSLVKLAKQAGFRGKNAAIAAATAMGESGGQPGIRGDGGASHGLWQIHTPSHPWARNLFNPLQNAKAAYRVWKQSHSFNPWTIFRIGAHRKFLPAALRAAQSIGNRYPGSGAKPKKRAKKRKTTKKGSGTVTPTVSDGELEDSGSTALDIYNAQVEDIDLQERAGILSPGQATAARNQIAQSMLGGGTGAWKWNLSDRDRWSIMGDVRERTPAADSDTAAETNAQLQQLNETLKEQVARLKALESVSQSQYGQLAQAITAVVSGAIGGRVGLSAQTPSVAGSLARY